MRSGEERLQPHSLTSPLPPAAFDALRADPSILLPTAALFPLIMPLMSHSFLAQGVVSALISVEDLNTG